jgi:hypothetical protein
MDNLSTVSLSDFVRNAQILWKKGADQFPTVMRSSGLVKEIAVPQNSGNTREFSEIDLEQYARRKAEREQAQYAKIQQGYSKTGTLYRVAFAEAITYEMRTQGKYPEVVEKLKNLLPTALNRMELDLQHRITFATSTSYTDMDGVSVDVTVGDTLALASTAHTVRGSSSTFRNRLANSPQLSRGGLEAMEKMRVENHINQFGQKMPVADDVLWTTDDPNTVNTARELLQSTASIDSGANSGVKNVYQSKYKHVALSRVATDKDGNVDSTKAKYWGLASTRESSFMLGVHEEPHVIPPSANGAQDALTDDWLFNVRGGWMIVIPSATWFCISLGDGTA